MQSSGFLCVWRNPISISDMAKELDAVLADLILLWIEGNSGIFYLCEGVELSGIMLLLVLSKDEYIIHLVDYTLQSAQYGRHAFLEVFRGTRDFKGELVEAESNVAWCATCH